jgi:hypothetical protein
MDHSGLETSVDIIITHPNPRKRISQFLGGAIVLRYGFDVVVKGIGRISKEGFLRSARRKEGGTAENED